MARGILSEYGPDAAKMQVSRITKNGPAATREQTAGIGPGRYDAPYGPIGINRTPGPGLGGANLGCCGTQGQRNDSGDGTSGSVGLGGLNRGMGSNRKG